MGFDKEEHFGEACDEYIEYIDYGGSSGNIDSQIRKSIALSLKFWKTEKADIL